MKISVDRNNRRAESGFTLVETLVAIVVLVFGLMAVTNLLLVAASSNTVANQASAATASASHVMDLLRSTSWANLPTVGGGGSLTADTTSPSPDCRTLTPPTQAIPFFNCDDNIPGVGTIKTRWQITPAAGTVRMIQITVASEGVGALAGARSRATFTTLRSCTQSAVGSCGIAGPCCLTD